MSYEDIVINCYNDDDNCCKTCPYDHKGKKCYHIMDIVRAIHHPDWYEVRMIGNGFEEDDED